jgi:hypothetical protein
MKKFNLQEALAGKPVISREGKQVTQLHLFNINESSTYSLFGVVDNDIQSFTKDGKWDKNSNEGSRDLFMEPEVAYVNVYKGCGGYTLGTLYTTREEAETMANKDKDYIKTVEITI